jgi:hypothetical protein
MHNTMTYGLRSENLDTFNSWSPRDPSEVPQDPHWQKLNGCTLSTATGEPLKTPYALLDIPVPRPESGLLQNDFMLTTCSAQVLVDSAEACMTSRCERTM